MKVSVLQWQEREIPTCIVVIGIDYAYAGAHMLEEQASGSLKKRTVDNKPLDFVLCVNISKTFFSAGLGAPETWLQSWIKMGPNQRQPL